MYTYISPLRMLHVWCATCKARNKINIMQREGCDVSPVLRFTGGKAKLKWLQKKHKQFTCVCGWLSVRVAAVLYTLYT